MRHAVVLFTIMVAVVAEAPYHLPRPAPLAPALNYPSHAHASHLQHNFAHHQSQHSSNGYNYQRPSAGPTFVQSAPAPQPIFVQQPQQPQAVFRPLPVNQPEAPQLINSLPSLVVPQPQQPQPIPQPQPVYQTQPIPQPLPVYQPQPIPQPQPVYQPQPVPHPLPVYQPQPAPQPQQVYQPQPAPQPQQVYQPQPVPQPQQVYQPQPVPQPQPVYQPQPSIPQPQPVYQPQLSIPQPQSLYPQPHVIPSQPSPSYGVPQHIQPAIVAPQPQIQSLPISSQSENSALSSYQADSFQYNNPQQEQTHKEALDETVVSRVQNIIKDSEHSSAKDAGYLSLVSGVSLENAKPSVEILSFVHNSPLSTGSSQSHYASSGSQGYSTNTQSSGTGSFDTTGFLPQTKPATSYGVPS